MSDDEVDEVHIPHGHRVQDGANGPPCEHVVTSCAGHTAGPPHLLAMAVLRAGPTARAAEVLLPRALLAHLEGFIALCRTLDFRLQYNGPCASKENAPPTYSIKVYHCLKCQ